MRGDFSRLRFNPAKNYTSVLKQQGRVSLDADDNEQRAIDDYLRTTETIDVVGKTGGPVHDEGFKIGVHNGNLEIGKGRYYVEGILCENQHRLAYSEQPFLIDPSPTDQELLSGLQNGSIGTIQVYLQVWKRMVTELDDPCLREPAIGADTTTRVETVWRVVAKEAQSTASGSAVAGANALLPASNAAKNPGTVQKQGGCCDSMITGLIPVSDPGKLNAQTGAASGDCSCQPTPAAGYFGLENQLYRVEIHKGGDESVATFKWSRENGSVVVGVTSIAASNVYVDSVGRDANLGFAVGQWVEISDDSNLFGEEPNQPGDLYQIQGVNPQTLCVTMSQPVAFVDPAKNARMRRWDQFGTSAGANGVSLSTSWVDVENGIEIEFSKGNYTSGDYWLIPARTATGNIEWPPCGSDGHPFQLPNHVDVFYAPLACIQWDSQTGKPKIDDCRKPFYPLTELTPCKPATTCCTYRVGDGKESFGDYTTIQAAIDALPGHGGEVCILPGRYYENVIIQEGRDIVIHGCGWQTRVASASLAPNAPAASTQESAAGAPVNSVGAVFSIVASEHIKLRSFVIEAADNEAGILIDGAGTSLNQNRLDALALVKSAPRGVRDVTIEDMVLTAAALPAILAVKTELLYIDRNRVAMKDVDSQWPAIYVSGTEIHIDRNRVRARRTNASDTQSSGTILFPFVVNEDLNTGAGSTAATNPTVNREFIDTLGTNLATINVPSHPGGIQVGGPSRDVYIIENEIQGGSRNGITLGGFEVLDPSGGSTGIWTGVSTTAEGGDCNCGATLEVPGAFTYQGNSGYRLVAGGILTNIQIHRNRIRGAGLCGIGPVGFFDLSKALEVITIVGLNISQNEISRTLLLDTSTGSSAESIGYGAICVPDVQNLMVCDNAIKDFGAKPGLDVCGIFVFHGEMMDISRNQVLETRDWTQPGEEKNSALEIARGGIVIWLATPPAFPQPVDSSLWFESELRTFAEATPAATPVYEPGLPAVRVEHNVVRVPLSVALLIVGVGPFSVVNNHLSCGGLVRSEGVEPAQTALILNFGTSIETAKASSLPSGIVAGRNSSDGMLSAGSRFSFSNGTVMFANNICQLEASAIGQRSATSVMVFTPDHLIFSGNHLWLEASRFNTFFDALLAAGSLNVTGNRFQEKYLSALFSGITVGVANITCDNIATNCLIPLGLVLKDANNICLIEDIFQTNCAALFELMLAVLEAEGV